MSFSGLLQSTFIDQPVSKLGKSDVLTLPGDASISEAISLLRDTNCGSLIVNDEFDEIVGILTERDIVLKLEGDGKSQTVEMLMTRDPVVIRKSSSIARALHSMSLGGFRHLPIVHSKRFVQGVLSVKDVVHYIYEKLCQQHKERDCEVVGSSEDVRRYFCSTLEIFNPHPPVTVNPAANVIDALKALRSHKIGSVLMVDRGEVIGMFTERDFLKKIAGTYRDIHTTVLLEYLSRPIETISREATVLDAYTKMFEKGFRHLPIVNEQGAPVGILSIKDFLDRLTEEILHELEQRKSS